MEITIDFDAEKIVGKLSALGRVQLPMAASIALNQTAFKIREQLQEGAKSVFKEVSPYTLSGFKYDKATPEKLEARVYINPDPQGGNARSDYLAPHIYGGLAYRTRFQKSLSRTPDPARSAMGGPILAPNRIMVPTQSPRGIRFNNRGKMMSTQYEQINTYIQNTDSTRTATTGRKTAKAAGTRYFYMNQAMVDERRNLRIAKPGIFMVRGGRYPLMRIMTESPVPTFSAKFQFFEIGKQTATTYFPQFLSKQKFL
jgi:hypothetical protein